MKRTRLRHQREAAAIEWQRQQKADAERAELWADFDSEALLAEALEAQENARELRRAREVKEEIAMEVLITEIDREVVRPEK